MRGKDYFGTGRAARDSCLVSMDTPKNLNRDTKDAWVYRNSDICVCCGAYVPEGIMVCMDCIRRSMF